MSKSQREEEGKRKWNGEEVHTWILVQAPPSPWVPSSLLTGSVCCLARFEECTARTITHKNLGSWITHTEHLLLCRLLILSNTHGVMMSFYLQWSSSPSCRASTLLQCDFATMPAHSCVDTQPARYLGITISSHFCIIHRSLSMLKWCNPTTWRRCFSIDLTVSNALTER